MSKIDIDTLALREAAERAIPAMERLLMLPVDDDLISEQELKDYGVDIDALNAFKFLAGPETVLALLDEREAQNKRIAELEKSEEQLINERDHAEAALADMYFAATGDRPEWSNWFGFSDAIDAVVDRIADLEAKQCIKEMSKQSCEARERDLFESWVMHSICISKSTLEGLRTETGYRNATLSGTDFNRMWEQWKSIRAAGIRIKGGE